jgi:hypothetical protein
MRHFRCAQVDTSMLRYSQGHNFVSSAIVPLVRLRALSHTI